MRAVSVRPSTYDTVREDTHDVIQQSSFRKDALTFLALGVALAVGVGVGMYALGTYNGKNQYREELYSLLKNREATVLIAREHAETDEQRIRADEQAKIYNNLSSVVNSERK